MEADNWMCEAGSPSRRLCRKQILQAEAEVRLGLRRFRSKHDAPDKQKITGRSERRSKQMKASIAGILIIL